MKQIVKKKWLAGAISFAAAGAMVIGAAGAASAAENTDPNASGNISISNIRISEIGAHSVGVTFDYQVNDPNGTLGVMVPVAFFEQYSSITPSKQFNYAEGYDKPLRHGPMTFGADGSFVGLDKVDDYKLSHESHTWDVYQEHELVGQATGRSWSNDLGKEQVLSSDKTSGTAHVSLTGLDPSTAYSKQGFENINGHDYTNSDANSALWAKTSELSQQHLGQATPVNMSRLLVGINTTKDFTHSDGIVTAVSVSSKTFTQPLQLFKTIAEPQPVAEDKLTNQGRNNLTPGAVNENGSARFYINSLSETGKAKVDTGQDCFWYSNIYSTPSKLTGPDGAPYTAVSKDDQGRYYFDASIPQTFSGEHTVVLADEQGEVQAWTKVNIAGTTLTQIATPPLPEPVAAPVSTQPAPAPAAPVDSKTTEDPAVQTTDKGKTVDPAAKAATASASKGELAQTGSNVRAVVGIALALMAAAAGCLAAAKRSRV
ncbi:hypothetical protein KIM372_04480 [Bombiscardovia nodaiensis]|uniref:Cell surface protein n=1 Tax=Bombiscardovia nodaiensis TaxID=2932181 RepID=A0ABM8B6W8_9BIFI|nr:hypothetical protein KIM372_04480 [Bombiscardovia nodaiensis]